MIFGNNWIELFYKAVVDFGEVAAVYFFAVVLLTKQILFSILVAFLLEHMKRVIEQINLSNKKRMIEKINIMKKVGLTASLNKLKVADRLKNNLQSLMIKSKLAAIGNESEEKAAEPQSENLLEPPKKPVEGQSQVIPRKGSWSITSSPVPVPAFNPFKGILGYNSLQVLPTFKNNYPKKFELNLKEVKESPSLHMHTKSNPPTKPHHSGVQIIEGVERLPNILSSPGLPELDLTEMQREHKVHKSRRTYIESKPAKLPDQFFVSPDPNSHSEPMETERPLITSNFEGRKDIEFTVAAAIAKTEVPLATDIKGEDPIVIHYKKDETIKRQNSRVPVKQSFCLRRWNSSFFLLHKDHNLRGKLQEFQESNTFKYFFLTVIATSIIIMALNDPYTEDQSLKGHVLWWFDLVLNSFLTIEFIWKSLAHGAIWGSGSRKPYFRNVTNLLDIFLVIITWITLIREARHPYLLALKPLRIIRVLNFLKHMGQSHTFMLILDTIQGAASKTSAFLVFIFLCLQPFAVIMMHMHGEPFLECRVANEIGTYLPYQCPSSIDGVTTKVGRDFSNYGEALLSSFVVITNEGFFSFTSYLMEHSGFSTIDYLNIFQTIIGYYFIALFLQNMFASLTFLVYSEKKQSLNRTSNLTEKERKIFDQQKVFISKKLYGFVEQVNQKPTFLTKLIESVWIELLSLILLFLSIILLCFEGGRHQKPISTAVQIIILTWFNLEIFLKAFASGFYRLIGDGLNVIDLLSTLTSDVLLVLYFAIDFKVNFMTPILIKFFGVGRALRRVLKLEHKISKSMKSLFDALITSFIQILPMLVIVFVALFGFSIAAMNLFYRIPYQDELNHAFNYRTIIPAFISILKYHLLTQVDHRVPLGDPSCGSNHRQGELL